jgi:mannosyltransferase OCH1-like enzyme
MIPKIIHYCWLSNDPIPENLQTCMNSWKTKLNGYEFTLWNFDRFDINSSIWVKEAFEAKKYAFASDFIRLYAIYNYGGIYLDMDIEVIRPFDDLLNQKYFIAMESEKGFEAAVLGFEKGSPIVKVCLDYYIDRSFYSARDDKNGNMTPLPQIMVQEIKKKYHIINRESIVLQNLPDTLEVFSPGYFTAKSFSTGKIYVTKNTYCIHHFVGSWLSKRDKKYADIKHKIYGYLGENIVAKSIVRYLYFIKRIQDLGFIETMKYYYNRLLPPPPPQDK